MTNDNNNNRGVLFKNEEKKENQPDYSGKLTVEGIEYKMSGWINTSKSNKIYISIKIRKEEKNEP